MKRVQLTKKWLFALASVLAMQFCSSAFAGTVDLNATDDPAWKQVFEGKSVVLPTTYPLGPGAVVSGSADLSGAKVKLPKLKVYESVIYNPIDLNDEKGLVWSDGVSKKKNSPKHFTSATIAHLLQDIVADFEKTQAGLAVPVVAFADATKPVMGRRNAVSFGWYTFDTDGNQADIKTSFGTYINGELSHARTGAKMKKQVVPSSSSLKTISLDASRQWALIKAILTQKSVVIDRISMPQEIRAQLLSYAIKNREDDALIKRFSEITVAVERSDGMRVRVGCSMRDRMLGCKGDSTKAEENRLNKITSMMLKDGYLSDDAGRIKALTQVATVCAHDNMVALLDYEKLLSRTGGLSDEDRKKMFGSFSHARLCNHMTGLVDYQKHLNSNYGEIYEEAEEEAPEESHRRFVWDESMTPKISPFLDGLNKEAQKQVAVSNSYMYIIADNPKFLPTLMTLYEDLHNWEQSAPKHASANSKINEAKRKANFERQKAIKIADVESLLAFISVADMPDEKLDKAGRIAYWKQIVLASKDKTKETLLREAFVRNNVQVGKQKPLADPSNMNVYITSYVRMVETNLPIALNIHALLVKAFHADIPTPVYINKTKTWRNVGGLNEWWKTNKILYIPTDNSSKFGYRYKDTAQQYHVSLIRKLGSPRAVIPQEEEE